MMVGHFGFLLLKPTRIDLTELLERFHRLMEYVGSAPRPTPPSGTLPPLGRGHMETVLEDGRIWTPEGVTPPLLNAAIQQYWPIQVWTDAARVSWYESNHWDARAFLDTRSYGGGRCNVPYVHPIFGNATTEFSIGYFQINSCAHGGDFAYWINADNNVRKAAELFLSEGWSPWRLTARNLGLQ